MSQPPFFPKKSFGQNFLINTGVQKKIIESCQLTLSDSVLEIGPGKGALTNSLSNSVSKVVAVEKDKKLAEHLRQHFHGSNVEIICEDILKFDLKKLPSPTKVIGNLPYNIATPIIEKVILNRHLFKEMYVMVQLEHGKRLVAGPKTKDYGSLSCFVQFYAEPKILFKISPGSFSPAPKVQSCFMSLKLLDRPRFDVEDEELLFKMIRLGFRQRRKTLVNALKDFCDGDIKKILEGINISDKARAEELSLKNFVDLASAIKGLNHSSLYTNSG